MDKQKCKNFEMPRWAETTHRETCGHMTLTCQLFTVNGLECKYHMIPVNCKNNCFSAALRQCTVHFSTHTHTHTLAVGKFCLTSSGHMGMKLTCLNTHETMIWESGYFRFVLFLNLNESSLWLCRIKDKNGTNTHTHTHESKPHP